MVWMDGWMGFNAGYWVLVRILILIWLYFHPPLRIFLDPRDSRIESNHASRKNLLKSENKLIWEREKKPEV